QFQGAVSALSGAMSWTARPLTKPDSLYQERLEQLNREEAMLTGDNPVHPVYLAMLQCLQERRDEKIRRSELELQFKLSVLRHRAVAERAQIMSQFYQAVRESRE